MTPRTWKTKDGRILLISEMETAHVEKCVKHLRKRYSEVCADFYPPAPDGGEEWFLDAPPTIEEMFPQLTWLREELGLRSLGLK